MPAFKILGFTIFIWRTPPSILKKDVLKLVALHYYQQSQKAFDHGDQDSASLFLNIGMGYDKSAQQLKRAALTAEQTQKLRENWGWNK